MSPAVKSLLLLQACCAPCACYPVELLKGEFDITLFFYNPNIHPEAEYLQRLEEIKNFCRREWPFSPTSNLVIGEYDVKLWFELTKGLENEPERGRRCDVCYEMRLRKTAEYARKNGFDWFGTGLTSSPYKKAEKINEIGKRLEKELGVKYYEADFKKKGGSLRAVELSKKYGFYRQNYCGCIYSKREREEKQQKRSGSL